MTEIVRVGTRAKARMLFEHQCRLGQDTVHIDWHRLLAEIEIEQVKANELGLMTLWQEITQHFQTLQNTNNRNYEITEEKIGEYDEYGHPIRDHAWIINLLNYAGRDPEHIKNFHRHAIDELLKKADGATWVTTKQTKHNPLTFTANVKPGEIKAIHNGSTETISIAHMPIVKDSCDKQLWTIQIDVGLDSC